MKKLNSAGAFPAQHSARCGALYSPPSAVIPEYSKPQHQGPGTGSALHTAFQAHQPSGRTPRGNRQLHPGCSPAENDPQEESSYYGYLLVLKVPYLLRYAIVQYTTINYGITIVVKQYPDRPVSFGLALSGQPLSLPARKAEQRDSTESCRRWLQAYGRKYVTMVMPKYRIIKPTSRATGPILSGGMMRRIRRRGGSVTV